MKLKQILAIVTLAATIFTATAQDATPMLPGSHKAATALVPTGAVHIDYQGNLTSFTLLANAACTVTPMWAEGDTPWYTITQWKNGDWKVKGSYWYKPTTREGQLEVRFPDGSKQYVPVVQEGNRSLYTYQGDLKVCIDHAKAPQQPSQSIEKSFDGDPMTHYHSPWEGAVFPVVIDYFFAQGEHLDYFIYTPRMDMWTGRWGQVTIEYATADAPDTLIPFAERDFGRPGSPVSIFFGNHGLDNVVQVRFTVKDAMEDCVSCGEMEFFQINHKEAAHRDGLFTNDLCYRLCEGITQADVEKETNPFLRQLAYCLLNEPYDTAYRVGEYEAYETTATLAHRLKTTEYCRYENPTGLFFEEGNRYVVFVEGLDAKYSVSLIVKNFGSAYGGKQPETTYPLHNGMNVFEAKHSGNGYVSYYTNDYRNAPNVRMHFPFANINGYFDLERGDTNEDWEALLANACSDIIDMRCQRLQVAFPTARFKQYCPHKGVELATIYDSLVYYERQVMGLSKYGIEPKNRQFARVNWFGFMYADGTGAAAHDSSLEGWMNPDNFGYWGLAHELGHCNQVRPGLKWVGCSEVTNNIYSGWVALHLSDMPVCLEHELYGHNEYSDKTGGRFNSYLEEGVRLGKPWQLQNGCDYFGDESKPGASITVPVEDYTGFRNGKDTTVISVNHDLFVKLAPLWQLIVYCDKAGFSPDVYAKVCQSVRLCNEDGMTDGQLQLKFIRTVCDSTQLNFLPFFEKAGLFKPVHTYAQDYGPDWLIITQPMLDAVSHHVAEQGYPVPEGEINYITGLNYKCYAQRLPVKGGAVNEGCTIAADKRFVKIDHQVWQNVVAFETYDAHDQLIRISMMGLGADRNISYTQAMFPNNANERASYIMAVGWDGTRIKCYERK